jgi:hypothetical protein
MRLIEQTPVKENLLAAVFAAFALPHPHRSLVRQKCSFTLSLPSSTPVTRL